MKKTILLFGCSLMTAYGFGQSDVSGPFLGHQRQAGRFVGWSPGFGSVAGPLDIRNDFNEPINLFTNGVQRMHINQDRSQTISGYTFNANGFIGIGQNSVAPTHPNGVWNDFGPFSILHINGFGGSEVKPSGFRPWMQAGISFTAFNDFSYL